MESQTRYTNYRFTNYMEKGVAVLKVSSPLEYSNSRSVIGDNVSQVAFVSHSKTHNPGKGISNSRSEVPRVKKSYDDKGVRTTKNFIGKPCYNVGYRKIFH